MASIWSRLDIFLLFSLTGTLIARVALPHNQTVFSLLVALSAIALLPVLRSAWQSFLNKQVAVDLLASIALIASFANNEWGSAAFINLMLTSARYFGDRTARNADAAIESLLKLKPSTVRVRRDGTITEIPANEVRKGDLIVIGLGERIAIDGTIIEGSALIDQSSLTGESLPVSKAIGDTVLSSTLNTDGSIVVRAEKVGADTTFEKIIRLVKESQNNKVGIQTLAQTFANWYIAFILIGSIGLYAFTGDHRLVLAFLLIACADDLAIAIPLAFSATIGNAARRGIIIKGSQFLEGLAGARAIFFDKTGTLTTGRLSIAAIIPTHGSDASPDDILSLAAALESNSTHPIAQAIRREAKTKHLSVTLPNDLRESSGRGVVATVDGHAVLSGRETFLEDHGVTIAPDTQPETLARKIFIARDGRHIGTLLLTDTIRPETPATIQRLRAQGFTDISMLTGDNEKVAHELASTIGLDTVHADLLPEDKVSAIKNSLNPDSKVIMVGDGVNDAAALAQSDIGIAMGTDGSDTAIEAADVALMQNDLRKIPEAIDLSRNVMTVARQNFWIWGVVNTIGLVLVFARILTPEGAAAYNFLTDFIPIANSLRIFRATKNT